MATNGYVPPVECLHEHLNYFSEAIVSKSTMLDCDFDDIFNQDFDLVFDPLMMQANPVHLTNQNHHFIEAHHVNTYTEPVHYQMQHEGEPIPLNVQSGDHHYHSTAPDPQTQALPMTAPSNSYMSQQYHHQPQTPAVPSKPVFSKSMITNKIAPAIVSPTSVTAVFEQIPQQQQQVPPQPTPQPVAKSSPRKRSYSMVQATKPAPKPVAAPKEEPEDDFDTSGLSFQEQEDLRRERNRHHAKRSRQRKRDYMNQLEDAVNDMRKENERLFELLGMDSTRAKQDMAKDEERKAAVATDKFIAGLKQPRNRVLDNTTLAFLRELWK